MRLNPPRQFQIAAGDDDRRGQAAAYFLGVTRPAQHRDALDAKDFRQNLGGA